MQVTVLILKTSQNNMKSKIKHDYIVFPNSDSFRLSSLSGGGDRKMKEAPGARLKEEEAEGTMAHAWRFGFALVLR